MPFDFETLCSRAPDHFPNELSHVWQLAVNETLDWQLTDQRSELFLQTLTACPWRDLTVEDAFTVIRRRALTMAREGQLDAQWTHSDGTRRLLVAIACQCHRNGYIYAVSQEEEVGLVELTAAFNSRMPCVNPSDAESTNLVVFAMYRRSVK